MSVYRTIGPTLVAIGDHVLEAFILKYCLHGITIIIIISCKNDIFVNLRRL